jgi:hypothetical protein
MGPIVGLGRFESVVDNSYRWGEKARVYSGWLGKTNVVVSELRITVLE